MCTEVNRTFAKETSVTKKINGDLGQTLPSAVAHPDIWRLTCDAISDPIFLHDAEFRVLLANRAYFLAAGRCEPQALGLPYWQVFPRGDGPLPECQLALTMGSSHSQEEIRVDERLFVSRGYPVKDEHGDFLYSLHIFTDITEHRSAELGLLERERWANLILDTAPEAMLVVDEQGLIIRANLSAAKTFGYEAGEMAGICIEMLLAEGLRGRHAAHRSRFMTQPQSRCMGEARHLKALRKDGREFDAELGLGPLEIDGRLFIVVSVVDITAQLKLQTERETILTEANRLVRARTDFMANMSHEIRTPLNGLLGLALAGQRSSVGRRSHNTFTRILDCGQHLMAVVNDILDIAKIEANKLTTTAAPFDLAQLIKRAVELTAECARLKGLNFRVKKSTDLPAACLGDEMRLVQVLVNLLSNAIKFTERGGITLSVSQRAGALSFVVTDTGIGMSQEQIGRLFNAFEQADSSTTRRYGGSGLGLAISRSLATLMGGEISVSSELDVGSCFELTLPLIEAELPIPIAALSEMPLGERLSGIRVLAAEDNEINRLVLEELLGSEGATLVCVEDGKQAVDRLIADGESEWDILLLDIQMPVMDGYQATQCLRELKKTCQLSVDRTCHA
ncbi:MAG: PAS domain S-box protein [Dechloromonas sp.]|uniref:histidine kinase n=1 Tax=Candidatus Dechloromonas phosphorivorans TaxID=2899244 RepID=A0A935KAS2_9RHOO|nr:PAS domain S-box protein [Candidatus Dechloromonas phosphorivorans]